jgi:hypothetical protein
MGRRKKQNSETEAEMEGSGDDHEPQGLAYLAAEFHKTLNLTESNLVHHLQESQETSHMEQAVITETLKKVDGNLKKIDENQTLITKLLLQMNHKGKSLRCMETKKPVDLVEPMVRSGIIQRKALDLKEAMEVERPMDIWVAGLTPCHTCLCLLMNKGNRKRWMILLNRWHDVPRSTTGWIW